MSTIETKYFGSVPFDDEPCFEFPWGLPAFEQERCFLPLQTPAFKPLLFLQSTTNPSICFIAVPVLTADPAYQLAVSPDDLEALELPPDRQPEIGSEVLVLTHLTLRENAPAAANLLAPIVINLASRRGLQAVRHDAAYSHEYPLTLLSAQ